MEPACRKRGFASHDIIALWPDIVGEPYAYRVQPERLVWPRRVDPGDPSAGPGPATLVVHTDGATAMLLSHDSQQVLDRLNTFFGWAAIARIKIIQRPIQRTPTPERPELRSLSDGENRRLEGHVKDVEDPKLKAALRKLGALVIARDQGGGG